jgi:Fic family protein
MSEPFEKFVCEVLKQSGAWVSASDIARAIPGEVNPRTLRRRLSQLSERGDIEKKGDRKTTRYRLLGAAKRMRFLDGLNDDLRARLLAQIRDAWTHSSTALEGNTLTLGDTHFILEQGLTISGKPLSEHQEVIGHARAIDLVYGLLNEPLNKADVFDMHKAVQTSRVTDIYKPNGAWKVEPNGTYIVTQTGEQVFMEYAHPRDIDALMAELISCLNRYAQEGVATKDAVKVYAKLHMGFAHIHPFWDGNGRMARLLANIPLLRSGLPPLTISADSRREYIQILADYQLSVGQLNRESGVWPKERLLEDFSHFCEHHYKVILGLLEKANGVQKRSSS